MEVHARISSEWRRRMIILFLMIFGSAAWFLYDGYVAWPAEGERHVVFAEMAEKMVADGQAKGPKDPVVARAWERLATERGWPVKVPKKRTPGEITGQRVTGAVLGVAALIFAAWVAWNHRLSVRAEGDWVTGANGRRVHLGWIVDMDRRKWASKGIAYAIYEEGGQAGARRRLTLDDHKFLGCEAIVVEAEKRIAARAGAGGGVDTPASVANENGSPGASA